MEIRTLFLFLATKLLMHYLVACISMTIPNITTDQSALLALKSRLDLEPNNILVNNWTTRTSVCNWIGVVCGHRHKRVVALNIPSMGLVGTLPPNLGNLSFLVQLNMYNNSFYGHLPEDLAKLRRLKYISVRRNTLGGQMPSWLGSLPNLQFLLLGNNSFTGKIPLEIGNLRDLRTLEMQHNQLTGTIPPHIFNISSLQLIALTSTGLSGNLPADMCYGAPQLKFLYLSLNNLSGEVPPSLHRCSELERLSLSYNNFTGPITSGFGNLTKLEHLYLGENHIQGSLPSGIGNCTNLKDMNLGYNNIAEYGSKGIVSTKGDVYSYGVMLLEAFSRTKPTDEMFVEEMSLKQWVNNSLHQASTEVIDADILTNNDENFIVKEQCIKSVMKLALSCCADSSEERVDLENVIATLGKIKCKFLTKIRGA